jgi:antitoxin PrlF
MGTTLTSKGQVVIPKPIRERLGWRPGTRLEVKELEHGAVRLEPTRQDDDFEQLLDEVAGSLSEGDALRALEAEHRAEVDADERWRRHRR